MNQPTDQPTSTSSIGSKEVQNTCQAAELAVSESIEEHTLTETHHDSSQTTVIEPQPKPEELSEQEILDENTTSQCEDENVNENSAQCSTPDSDMSNNQQQTRFHRVSSVTEWINPACDRLPTKQEMVQILPSVADETRVPRKRVRPHYRTVGLLSDDEDTYTWPFWPEQDMEETTARHPTGGARSTRSRTKQAEETENSARKSSRVGDMYQVAIIPQVGTEPYSDEGGDVLWDPVVALQARTANPEKSEQVELFLSQKKFLPTKAVALQALHESGYDPIKAQQRFEQLVHLSKLETGNDVSHKLTDEEIKQLWKVFENQPPHLDFLTISNATGHSLDAVMVCYYGWRSSKQGGYPEADTASETSFSDYCEICQDGGTLVVCDLCNRAFHLKCLNPPLEKVPESKWYCRVCKAESPTRLHSGGAGRRLFSARSKSPSSREREHKAARRKLDVGNDSKSDTYVVDMPLTRSEEGRVTLGILINFDPSIQRIVFNGFVKQMNGQKSHAEKEGALCDVGDVIVSLNEIKIEGLKYKEGLVTIQTALQQNQEAKSARLVMRRRVQVPKSPPLNPRRIDNDPKRNAMYSPSRVRARTMPDGTVVPARAPKRLKDGTFQCPAGRPRSGMKWDESNGVWIGGDTKQETPISTKKSAGGQGGRGPTPTSSGDFYYMARVPVTPKGIMVTIVQDTKRGGAYFGGYRPNEDKSPSPVMLMDPPPFRNEGDQIVGVDGRSVCGMKFSEIVELLKDHGDKMFRLLRMKSCKA